MIDLSPMKSVRVDPQGKTVRAEAGVTTAPRLASPGASLIEKRKPSG
jgi:hypothetical protein